MIRIMADKPLDMPVEQHGIVLRRIDHELYTNVPHLVIHHSPTGYEWGYGGSGPADLALNILEWQLRREGYRGPTVQCFEGRCFWLAWSLHQDFKRDIVAVCASQEACIPLATVSNWLSTSRLVAASVQYPGPAP